MEFYYFYNMITMLAMLVRNSDELLPILGFVVGGLLWLIFFVLQGIGISKMAKKRRIKNRALAFVPFVNIWYLGKLAGECQFFGQRVKRAGMYTMIVQIIATLLTLAVIFAEAYLWMNHGVPEMETELGSVYWAELTGFSLTVFKFYELSGYMLSIAQLICEIFLVILVMGLYKQYEPRNYFVLSMLTLFVPVSRFIIIFALRNRKAIDFDAYMRARREAYARRQQQYYNPYNDPYNRQGGNPYQNGGYGQDPYRQNGTQTQSKPEDPFSEFSSNRSEQNSSHRSGDSDGFFD